jgi:hypothetical protein
VLLGKYRRKPTFKEEVIVDDAWCLVDEGDYSSLFPDNGAKKELDAW